MHPDLLNNSIFLRYYKQWQDDPSSIVFASIAEFFLRYDMIDEAFKVCRIGVKRHPGLVSGRIVMAKIHLRRGNWEEAEEELRAALSVMPSNRQAGALMDEITAIRERERASGEMVTPKNPHLARGAAPGDSIPDVGQSWKTVTMAGIYASQGHFDRARGIYEAILRSDPANESARRGLETLPPV